MTGSGIPTSQSKSPRPIQASIWVASFTTRQEAEGAMKTVKVCESVGTVGGPVVPTANPKPLTATANRLILAPDGRSLQVDLVRLDRTVQVAGRVGSRDSGPSTPTQRAAAQIPEAIGVRQHRPPSVCGTL